jgi:hypothetical protein
MFIFDNVKYEWGRHVYLQTSSTQILLCKPLNYEEKCMKIVQMRYNNQGGSECLLFNANSEIFQLYHGENKLIFNEMMMSECVIVA